MQMIAIFFLVTASIGGAAWVFIYPHLSGERRMEKRQDMVARPGVPARSSAQRTGTQKSRREQVEGSLKELEQRRSKAKSLPLSTRIAQAGLSWSKQRFFFVSALLGLVGFGLALVLNAGLLVAGALGFAGAFGLPLLDSIRVITNDSPEPIRSEFRAIVETQSFGIPLGDACAKLYERIPVAEANFFGIVIGIQQKSGGNLAEALGNLSRVLRDRKKMKAKIHAMSMEAKASAMIIGSLPPGVMFLVWLTSPAYIELLWTQPLGRVMLMACGFWMSLGILVMRKMINFDF